MKSLIIAEKPSLARKIVDAIGGMKKDGDYYEGEKYIVISAFGHLLTLVDLDEYLNKKTKRWDLSDLNYFPTKFRFKVKPDKGVKERYSLIKKLISRNDVDTIVNAGDSDREGEVLVNIIVYSIFGQLKTNKKLTRIWLEDQTKKTICSELNHQRDIADTTTLYNEGLARMYVDWLYGIYLTRYVCLKSGSQMIVGRVIIPSVKFIYDRYMEIKNFVPEKYYKITCPIDVNGENVVLDFKDMKYSLAEKSDADRIISELKSGPIVVTKVENKDVTKQPKRLFSLPTLQNYMNKNYKWSLKKTLSVAQLLYENGYTTYPRTNTEYLAEQEKNKMKDIIDKTLESNIIKQYNCNNLSFVLPSKLFDNSKIESHSAITITEKIPSSFDKFSDDEKLLYNVILGRFLANFYSEKCVVTESKVSFSFKGSDKEYTTSMTGQVVKEKGYLIFENDLKNKIIPTFRMGEMFYCHNPKCDIKETEPPNNVTENEINKFFENPFKKNLSDENTDEDYKNILAGVEIGTTATRADMIEKIKKIGYVESKKNALIITEKGITFIDILRKLNINLWAEKTALLSQDLKKIYKGEKTIDDIVADAENEIKSIISQPNIDIKTDSIIGKEVIGTCPLCGKPVVENKKAFGCSDWKNGCKFTIWKTIAGKSISKTDAKDLLDSSKNYTTKMKTGFKNKAGKTFNARLYLNKDNEIKFDFSQ